jgi:hypothetical protein
LGSTLPFLAIAIKVDAKDIPAGKNGSVTLANAGALFHSGQNIESNSRDANKRFMPDEGESTINS